MRPITRRQFLGQTSCAALSSVGLISTLLNLRMAGTAAAQSIGPGEDFRALVCLFFAGGIDSYNLLTPAEGDAYAAYRSVRGDLYSASNLDGLALDSAALRLLPADAYAAFRLGIHPSFGDHNGTPGLASLANAGKVAFVANVGTLVERTTKAQYTASTAKLPRGLYSHADQVQQWHTSVPIEARGIGWAGLAADLLHSGNTNAKVSMNISLGGNNIWQTGNALFPYTISSAGSVLPSEYNSSFATPAIGTTSRTAIRTAAMDNMLQQSYANLLQDTFAATTRDSIEASEVFQAAFGTTSLTTKFPGDDGYTPPAGYTNATDPARTLGQQFRAAVRTLQARTALGMRRQTLFINYGGWDHHDETILTMQTMLDVVNRCLASYWQALGEIGLQDKVTLFTASDFARTLTSNGAGSDHAWGGNQFVLGGAVNGGRVYGSYPDLALSGPSVVTTRGATIPGLSVDEYFAELALWLGVTPGDLPAVLPRIREFYTPGSLSPPVGFMSA